MRTFPGLSPCPAWCHGPEDHSSAIEEGCDLEEISHISDDLGMRLNTLSNPYVPGQILRECPGSIGVQLRQDAQIQPFGGYPVLELEVTQSDIEGGDRRRIQLNITSGEARTLSAMLLHLADQMDLHHCQ